jgi:hypothetical protein
MAVHRRPPVEGPPAELLTFRGDDWISGDGVPPLERWHKARLSGLSRIRMISLWVAMCWICCVSGWHISGACSRDPYSVDGFRPSRLCSAARI